MPRRDEAAFTDFVRRCAPQLLRTAWLLSGSAAAAEDLVQGALERLYVAWPRVQPESALPYTLRILVNLHIDTGRRRSREHLTDAVPERSGGPDLADDVVLASHLSAVLATLPPRERQCVVLRFHADLSESEVADLLGTSVGTVKSSTSRGLHKLRQVLILQGGPNG
jgi:RNA polymerase sigma-70 factor (sigma-E family)